MGILSGDNFGLIIAYLLPGFVVLWSASSFSPTLQAWLGASPPTDATVGGFLYVTLGSTAAGLIVSAVRWALVDRLLHSTGIPEPRWSFARLADRLAAFEGIVQNHYRYYQGYSNMLVAVVFAYTARLLTSGRFPVEKGWADLGILLVGLVLYLGARDTLRKYYARAGDILQLAPSAPPAGGSESRTDRP